MYEKLNNTYLLKDYTHAKEKRKFTFRKLKRQSS